jgi:hypothetical protein
MRGVIFVMVSTIVGCGAPCVPIDAAIDGDAMMSAEFVTFDQGLCRGFCTRLVQCGVICQSLSPVVQNCTNDSVAAFDQCLRGGLNVQIFALPVCPHACPAPQHFAGATSCDAQRCANDVGALSCSATGAGSIGQVFENVPPSCVQYCQ